MAAFTNELMYELLKSIRQLGDLKQNVSEVKVEPIAMRGLARHEERLDRIAGRLELRELAEAQRAYQSQ